MHPSPRGRYLNALLWTSLFPLPSEAFFFGSPSQKFSPWFSAPNGEESVSIDGPSTPYFDPECEGESCFLPCEVSSTFPTEAEKRLNESVESFLFYVPILSPILAFVTYRQVASLSDDTIHFLAQNTWVAVDGGAYENKIIAPAINGVVIPAITILFATLLSNTFATLRQRQQDIRTTINMEAAELRVLASMVDLFTPEDAQTKCRSYLLQYTSRLIAESQPGTEFKNLVAGDSEMNGFLNTLNTMSVSSSSSASSALLPQSYAAVARLNSERSQRISSLQSTFPPLHFGILTVLAVSICLAFLMETNLEILIFLNAIQLKILWTMLIGTFSALGVVCYDLGDPFRGSYQIGKTINQLYTIRSAVRASEKVKKK
jgi:hypothetical protein